MTPLLPSARAIAAGAWRLALLAVVIPTIAAPAAGAQLDRLRKIRVYRAVGLGVVRVETVLERFSTASVISGDGIGLTRPPATKPTVIAGPASLTARGAPATILLVFPGVSGAAGFRITRTNNAGDPETIVFEGSLDNFAFNGAACTVAQGCAYTDAAVSRGFLYSYRVFSLFPNSSGPPIVSPPSPVASAQLTFARVR